MKKRILSLMLAPVLLFSMAAPAFAAESGDSADRLAAVTSRVKTTLALDTERYKEFSGQLNEGELSPTWRLSWSGEDGSLEVTAVESGKVLSYYRYDAQEEREGAALALPKGDPAKAKTAADAFLKKVLEAGETVSLNEPSGGNSLNQTRYYFQGTVLLNGLDSPLRYSLSVRASDYAVVHFHRDSVEEGYIGSVPAADFHMESSDAQALLRDTLSLRLEYVLEEGAKTAVLRYLPNQIHSFYVDDATGKLVDLTELYNALGRNSTTNGGVMEDAEAPAEKDDAGSGLTAAEQLGADKLKGTLSKEALDQKARAVSQLGLDSYALASASYQEREIDGASVIAARLTYGKRAEERTFRRWVTLDAKTGALLEVSSSGRWDENKAQNVDEAAARKTAEEFLASQRKDRFAQCGAYTDHSAFQTENGRYGIWSFQYARKANGYFFANDQLGVGIDTADGSVASFSQSWTADVAFDSADGVISADKALNAYHRTFQLTKGYAAVPQKLDLSDPDYAPLAEMGYSALNALKLGWQLTAPEQTVSGIDAKTGKPVYWTAPEIGGGLKYDDLTGSDAKSAVESLAKYGVGYAGGKFRPEARLTQLDLVALLASTQGVTIDPSNPAEGDADRAYRAAYSMGALQRGEREDSRALSRMDAVKLLLDAGGYGPAARLQGIYRTDFSDQDQIPENMLGYAALAQAMKVVRANDEGNLAPSQTITRGDAAVMLLAFMERD